MDSGKADVDSAQDEDFRIFPYGDVQAESGSICRSRLLDDSVYPLCITD